MAVSLGKADGRILSTFQDGTDQPLHRLENQSDETREQNHCSWSF